VGGPPSAASGSQGQNQPGAEALLYGAGVTTEPGNGSAYGPGGKIATAGAESPPGESGGATVYGAGQDATEEPAAGTSSAPNRLRPPPRAGGAYGVTDDNPPAEQSAATEETPSAAEAALVQEATGSESVPSQ